jgi:hypothetical protein
MRLFAAGFAAIGVAFAIFFCSDRLELNPTTNLARALFVMGSVLPAALFAFGVLAAAVALVQMARGKVPRAPGAAALLAVGPLLTGGFMTFLGAFFTLLSTIGFARGRQLRKRGKVLLAPLAVDDGWTRLPLLAEAPEELRTQLADRWRENGRTEHASVAAFARLTMDLMALGAPARLIEDANRDSLDEIRHADLCFSLARALDGKSESPAPFAAVRGAGPLPRWRTLALAQLAVDSLVDGALHEGLSARVLARLAKRCQDPAVREVLLELARDEGRHAAHGWDVVDWCLGEGGAPVGRALLGAVRALPQSVASDLPPAMQSGAWERYGLHGQALEAEEHAKARADLTGRVQRLVSRKAAPTA